MFKFWKTEDAGVRTAHYEGSFRMDDMLDTYMMKRLKEDILESLTKAWIKEFGAELLEKVTPGLLEDELRKNIAERILK